MKKKIERDQNFIQFFQNTQDFKTILQVDIQHKWTYRQGSLYTFFLNQLISITLISHMTICTAFLGAEFVEERIRSDWISK